MASVLADQRKYSAQLRQSLLCWGNGREYGPLTLARIQELSLVGVAVEFWISMGPYRLLCLKAWPIVNGTVTRCDLGGKIVSL